MPRRPRLPLASVFPTASVLLLALLAAACQPLPPPTAAQRAQRAEVAACRSDTDAAFEKQNRYLLSERDTTDSPYSSSGDTGITTRGLSQQYGYDEDFSRCLAATKAGNPNGPGTSLPPPARSGSQGVPYSP